ncbi:MAG: hypothetical protein M1277_00740 [Patescibacteria group bacterium]|nr:hypothetical protein [Patescibacteria group bacterium]
MQEIYAPSVNENKIEIDKLWGKRCLGYNIQAHYSKSVLDALRDIQAKIMSHEQNSLNIIPQNALHLTIAWILATRQDYGMAKDQLWETIGKQCCTELERIGDTTPELRVNFKDVVATDKAIILVGYDNGGVDKLREKVYGSLPIPKETQTISNIIHTTLFRYSAPLSNPQELLEYLPSLEVNLTTIFNTLSIEKELTYPSLSSQSLFNVRLNNYTS